MTRPAVSRRRSDDVAHRGGLAFGRVEMASPSGEPREFGPYGLQFGDALFDVDRPSIDELTDVVAGHGTAITKGDDPADLTQREPRGLCGTDERQPVQDRVRVAAVAVGAAFGGWQHLDGLVVADRLGRHSGALCELSDQHAFTLPLDLPVCRNVHHEDMEITVLYVADCPSLDLARKRVAEAVARVDATATVTERLVIDAEALGFAGSPTILVDGADLFTRPDLTTSLTCRLYPTPDGLQGAPTVDELVDAFHR